VRTEKESNKRMGRINAQKLTHIGIVQRIGEQDRVPRSGGLAGLVLGDDFGAVKVVFLGYDGQGACHCLSKTISFSERERSG
jgi:hypothetical protein